MTRMDGETLRILDSLEEEEEGVSNNKVDTSVSGREIDRKNYDSSGCRISEEYCFAKVSGTVSGAGFVLFT